MATLTKRAPRKPPAQSSAKSGQLPSPLAVESWPLDRFVPYLGNARRLSDRAVAVLASSLKEFGWQQPIVVDKKDVIIAGHTRLLAAQSLGLTHAPAHVAKNLTAAQCDAYRIMDNRSSEETDWINELLWPQLLKLEKAGIDLALTGFTQEELNALLKAASLAAGQCDEDEAPEPPANPVSVLGDVWTLGDHRVMCGDSTDAETTQALFAGAVPEVVFTDPPYGIDIVKGSKVGGGGKLKFGKVGGKNWVNSSTYAAIEGDSDTAAARGFYLASSAAGVKQFVIWGGNYFTDFLPPSSCWLIWDKQNTGNFADVEMAWSTLLKGAARDAEMAWASYPKGAKLYSYMWNGLAREGDRKGELVSRVHPTQKPVGLFERIFGDFPFMSCYDGFLGSGSTLIACEKTGRRCYGMELAPAYVDVAVLRWQSFTGREALLNGATFAEVKAARE